MRSILKKPFLPLSAIVVVAACAILLTNTKPFAEQKRPARGTVTFGSQNQPDINIPSAFATVFADAAEKVVPTVVSVIPTKIDTVTFSNNPFYQFFNDPFFGGNPFEEFFGGPRQERRAPQQQQQPQTRRRQGMGSGVIVSREGHILTNCHVVSGADEIEVKTADGRSFEAYVVGSDSLSDVAVIKIKDNVKNLPVAYLGDSDKLRPGDWALAIGNPFSLTSSVTLGIVSATGRATPSGNAASFQNFIQTDAAINPGNSGGALVNIRGELVGINTMIYTQSGGNMGIGFAIPINMARRIMEDLIFDGKVSRGWLGVSIQELDQSTRDAFGLKPETKGVLIGDVFKDQPADKAGIKRGDVVTKIDGKNTETINQLRNQVAALHPGKTVPVEVLRNNKRMTVQVKITVRDESEAAKISANQNAGAEQSQSSDAASLLGMKIGPVTQELRDQLKLSKGLQGVVITEVARSSQAAQEGLRPNDIILEVNRKTVQSVKDFSQITKDVKADDSTLLLIQRDGNTFYRAFKIRK
ncbi:MAG: Do family serine endopeptidase [Chitinispirillales bacterium]|jgi:serine protease Do|nr:Do family serine endopeptidase [Chitinispirillales bacterium]